MTLMSALCQKTLDYEVDTLALKRIKPLFRTGPKPQGWGFFVLRLFAIIHHIGFPLKIGSTMYFKKANDNKRKIGYF